MPQIHELNQATSAADSDVLALDNGTSTKKITITALKQAMLDAIYPVGSIYISINSTNPSVLFGGNWVRIKDRFLLAAGDTYSGNSLGGAASVTLDVSELPKTEGTVTLASNIGTNVTGAQTKLEGASGHFSRVSRSGRNILKFNSGTYTVSQNQTLYDQFKLSFGSGQAHENMPPYYAVYVWRRSA